MYNLVAITLMSTQTRITFNTFCDIGSRNVDVGQITSTLILRIPVGNHETNRFFVVGVFFLCVCAVDKMLYCSI